MVRLCFLWEGQDFSGGWLCGAVGGVGWCILKRGAWLFDGDSGCVCAQARILTHVLARHLSGIIHVYILDFSL